MKKLKNILSPFILLLIPVFIAMAVLTNYSKQEIPAERLGASLKFQMPSLKNFAQVVLR